MADDPKAQGDERTELARELADSARARAGLYRLIAGLYLQAPDGAVIENLADNLDEGLALGDPDMARGWELIGAFLDRRDMGTRLELAVDFACALGVAKGTGKAAVSPREGAYAPGGASSDVDPCGEVRDLAREAGIDVGTLPDVPEDHLSYECALMAALADAQAQALDEGRPAEAVSALATQDELRARHLATWAGAFCDKLEGVCTTDFYRGLAAVTRAFVRLDAGFVEDSLAAARELAAE